VFSRRCPSDLNPNALARLREERSPVPFDLTVSNPTACGFRYPEGLLEPLGGSAGRVYAPDPIGLESAREAVAAEYVRHGTAVWPGSVVLTASTSEAYSLLFKLLTEPGDEILVPVPSYPLFEHLARLDGVRAVPYRLDPAAGWQPDLSGLAGSRARAVIAVHPNNPTGTYVDSRSARSLASFCAERDAALIVDEVFHAYPLSRTAPPPGFAATTEALTFALGGLSKYVGLPQVKLAWIVVSGPSDRAATAVERLSFIADQYLSVGTPVQLALPHLLREGARVREEIRQRAAGNSEQLASILDATPALALIPPEGGWSAVLRFPRVVDEETLALDLLASHGVAVQPGYFFDFPEEGYVAMSLLPEPEIFREGVRRLVECITSRLTP
jgi:hypothetical protein